MKPMVMLVSILLAMSSVAVAETITLDAPTCGPAIKKEEVTVIDAREIDDMELLADQLRDKLGPYSAVDSAYVETSFLKFSSTAVRKAKGKAAKKGCNLLVVLDRGQVGTGRFQATVPQGSSTAYGSEVQHGATTVIYGCTWGATATNARSRKNLARPGSKLSSSKLSSRLVCLAGC